MGGWFSTDEATSNALPQPDAEPTGEEDDYVSVLDEDEEREEKSVVKSLKSIHFEVNKDTEPELVKVLSQRQLSVPATVRTNATGKTRLTMGEGKLLQLAPPGHRDRVKKDFNPKMVNSLEVLDFEVPPQDFETSYLEQENASSSKKDRNKVTTGENTAQSGEIEKFRIARKMTLQRYDKVFNNSRSNKVKTGVDETQRSLRLEEMINDEELDEYEELELETIKSLFFQNNFNDGQTNIPKGQKAKVALNHVVDQADAEKLKEVLWENRVQHNWLNKVRAEDIEVEESDYNYQVMEREVLANIQSQQANTYGGPTTAAASHFEADGNLSSVPETPEEKIRNMKKELLVAQDMKVSSAKNTAKLLDRDLRKQILDLKRQLSSRTFTGIVAAGISPLAQLGTALFRPNKANNAAKKKVLKRKGTKGSLNANEGEEGDGINDAESKVHAEIEELKWMRRTLWTEIHFPGLMRWRMKAEATPGLYIGAKDIELAELKGPVSMYTQPNKGMNCLVLKSDAVYARVGILELAIKGKSSLVSLLGGIVNPTIKRLDLVLNGSFCVAYTYSPEKKKWEDMSKLTTFKLQIQKETKGVRNIVLPNSLVNLLGKVIFPKLITNSLRDFLPSSFHEFDNVFNNALLKKLMEDLRVTREVAETLIPRKLPFLANEMFTFHLGAEIDIQGDLDFNVWRAPLFAPTKLSAAARRALDLDGIDEGVELDILLRSKLAEAAGFNTSSAVTLEKLWSWRLKLATYSLDQLKPMIDMIEGYSDPDDEGFLFSVFKRTEKLADKPFDGQLKIISVQLNLDLLEMIRNAIQFQATRFLLTAKNPQEIADHNKELLSTFVQLHNLIRLRGELTGNAAFLFLGPVSSRRRKGSKYKSVELEQGSILVGLRDLKLKTKFEHFAEYQVFTSQLREIAAAVQRPRPATSPSGNGTTFPLLISAHSRNPESKEYLVELRTVRPSKAAQDPRKAKHKSLLEGSSSKCQVGMGGIKLDMFNKEQQFGDVSAGIELLQGICSMQFLDDLLAYLLGESENLRKSKVMRTTEYLQKQLASYFKQGSAGSTTKELLKQTATMIHLLNGSASSGASQKEDAKALARTSPEDFEILPNVLKKKETKLLAQLRPVQFQIQAEGAQLFLRVREQHDDGVLQLRFRVSLVDALQLSGIP